MRNYFRLIGYSRPHLHVLLAAIGCMVVTTIFKNSPIALLVPAVDRILADKPITVPNPEQVPQFILDLIYRANAIPRLELLGILICVMIGFTIIQGISMYAQSLLMSDLSHRIIRDLRQAVYEKLVHLPLKFYSQNRAGEMVSRITYDTGVVRDAISEGLLDAFIQPMELLINIAIVLSIRQFFDIPWSFVLVLTVVMPLIIYPVVRIGKMLKKISHRVQGDMADLNASLYETMSGIRVVQAFGMEKYEKEKFKRMNWAFYQNMMRHISKNQMIQPITDIVLVLSGSAVVWYAGIRVIEGNMSAGAAMAFGTALLSLSRPFKRLSRLHGINQTSLAAAERIFSILDQESEIQEIDKPVHLSKFSKEIRYEKVQFGYHSQSLVLREISFNVKAGEVVAVVGGSGAGKSTLLNLLPRFYDPTQGRVTIDGTPVKNVSIESLRHQIGIVTQETILFNDSVSANIAYGKNDISQETIAEAAKVANAHEFISKLPQGYQTVIGDRGFKLSGGEKQRLAIARAILKNPPILILDEATSALDSESERLVQGAIHNLMRGRTVLVIAHRLSTIRHADRILVLREGLVVEEGGHDELLAKNGLYKRLYDMQFSALDP